MYYYFSVYLAENQRFGGSEPDPGSRPVGAVHTDQRNYWGNLRALMPPPTARAGWPL